MFNLRELKRLASSTRSLFLRGVQSALPLVLMWMLIKTVYGFANSWLGYNSEVVAGWIFPHSWLIGPFQKLLGLLAISVVVLLVGLLGATVRGRKILPVVDCAIAKLPLFGGIYAALRKIINTFAAPKGKSGQKRFQMAVLVDVTGHGQWQWGLVTGETIIDGVHHLIVMLPCPPNPTGGAIRYVPDHQWKQMTEVSSSSQAMEVLMSYGLVTPPVLTILKSAI